MEIIFGIVFGSVISVGIVLFFLTRKNEGSQYGFRNELQRSLDQFSSLMKERFDAEGKLAKADLDHKKDGITHLVEELRRDLSKSKEYLKESDEGRVSNYASIKQELELNRKVLTELRGSTDDLKRILSNNQLRGAFGEQVAENLLKMAGFVIGQDYIHNKEQESVETRPDFTIFLPDKTKIHVDAKFPYTSLVRATHVENPEEREQYLRQFTTDVKQKIKQVSTREYINPEEQTVDFVIMFIPNEMIFSFIYDQMNEVWEDGMRKKVIMAGPFNFTAILRMVKQSYSSFRYQQNLHHVIGLIQKFETEYEKFGDALNTLGDRMQSAVKQFEAVSTTRSRVLNKIVDQIRSEEIVPEPEYGKQKTLKGD